MFEISWTLTLDTKLSIECYQLRKNKKSIKNLAKIARYHLKNSMKTWRKENWIQKKNIPNIINIDYANKVVTQECIRLSAFSLESKKDR